MQHSVREDMPALRVSAQLRFVQSGKGELSWFLVGAPGIDSFAHRHRFRCAQIPTRADRFDSLLTGNQRDLFRPFNRNDAVINLARQQPQRKAHHPAAMRAQSLHREMRLAGVGRTENRFDWILGERHCVSDLSADEMGCQHKRGVASGEGGKRE